MARTCVYAVKCALLAAVSISSYGTAAASEELAAAVAAVKKATERFADVNVAHAEGYTADPTGHCVTAEAEGLPAELGGMGIHYLNPALLGLTASEPRVDGTGTHTDFDNPAVLLYEPQADGSLMLVGAENLVFKKAWDEAGNTSPPVFAGREWDYMADDPATEWDYMADDPATDIDEAHGFEPHYDQHIYFRGDDIEAAVRPFHPMVNCDRHTGDSH